MHFYQAIAVIFAVSLFAALSYIYKMSTKLKAGNYQKNSDFGGNMKLELQDMKESVSSLKQQISKRRSSLNKTKRK